MAFLVFDLGGYNKDFCRVQKSEPQPSSLRKSGQGFRTSEVCSKKKVPHPKHRPHSLARFLSVRASSHLETKTLKRESSRKEGTDDNHRKEKKEKISISEAEDIYQHQYSAVSPIDCICILLAFSLKLHE
jgi:hypothetical protein